MSEDTGWLIEHPHDPRYGRESWYSSKDGFTIDSLQAVRFARKEDAVREIDRFPTVLAKNLIAAHHSWIPARVCPHGQLQRQCEICEAKEEAAYWRSKGENAFEPIRKIADALAQGGFHCHDKPGFVADHVPGLVSEAITELKIKHEWLYGGTKDKAATRTNFMHDPNTRVLLMNSVAGGTGNDGLQTVAQYMVFFETPTDPTTRKQVEARIHRPGQRHRTFFYDLTIKRSIDKGILESIAEGHDLYEAVVNGKRLLRDILRG